MDSLILKSQMLRNCIILHLHFKKNTEIPLPVCLQLLNELVHKKVAISVLVNVKSNDSYVHVASRLHTTRLECLQFLRLQPSQT